MKIQKIPYVIVPLANMCVLTYINSEGSGIGSCLQIWNHQKTEGHSFVEAMQAAI